MAKGSKHNKASKPRPDKYAEKVAINVGFEQAMQIFADAASKNVAAKIEKPATEEREEV